MARIAFEKIMAGLEDALAYVDGDASRGAAHQVKVADVDITHLREKLGLKLPATASPRDVPPFS